MTAEASSWFWDFEMRIDLSPLHVPQVSLEHLGNSQGLQSSGNNGRFYRATFSKSGATIVDLRTDITTHFTRRSKNTPYHQMSSRVLRDGTVITYLYDKGAGAQSHCQNVRIRHEASGASVYVHRNRRFKAQACLPLDITLPDGNSKV